MDRTTLRLQRVAEIPNLSNYSELLELWIHDSNISEINNLPQSLLILHLGYNQI